MDIAHIPGATRTIGESQGYLGLPLRDEPLHCTVNGPTTPSMVTAWIPTPDEIAALMAGAAVYVRILGTAHPPIMLGVGPAGGGEGDAPPAPVAVPEANEDWREDPAADERWNAGCDFAMKQLCVLLGVDQESVSWEAATEEVDGDVRAVLGNIMDAGLGENWRDYSPAAPVPPAAPSPASPEKGTERMREALRILRNALAFYSTGKHFYGDIIVDRGEHARAALASLPAEPEGETWFAADVRRASERQGQIGAASPSGRAAALSALAEMDADEILATHPTAPKPAEVRVKGLEWTDRGEGVHPRWLAHSVSGDYAIDRTKGGAFQWWTAVLRGKCEEKSLAAAKAAAQANYERRILSALEPSPAPAAEEFRRGAEAMRLLAATYIRQSRGGYGSIVLAEMIMNIPLMSGEG